VLIVSATEDVACMRECLDAGAAGYITKSDAVVGLPGAMKTVMAGERYLPPHLQQ
jgi:DNA-binding NarL/FixJ family response regulator